MSTNQGTCVGTVALTQEALFPELPELPGGAPGWRYAAHLFQRSAAPLWKLGYTEVSVLTRARQIGCVPVAWLPGSMRDEREMHRRWKHHRMSPAAEFFFHGDSLDEYVRQMIGEMPALIRDRQFDVWEDIMRRVRQQTAA